MIYPEGIKNYLWTQFFYLKNWGIITSGQTKPEALPTNIIGQ